MRGHFLLLFQNGSKKYQKWKQVKSVAQNEVTLKIGKSGIPTFSKKKKGGLNGRIRGEKNTKSHI